MTPKITISSGPLQGITDDVFRMVHSKIFGGIDEYYGPYIRLEENSEIKKSQWLDAPSTLNGGIPYIPQILSNNPVLMIEEMKRYHALGLNEANWNLGCPYPMVTRRKLGAGLLSEPQMVDEILSKIMPEIPIKLSIKCRLGLVDATEIYPLLQVFDAYDISKIIIHARTAKQMYGGEAQADKILPLLALTRHKMVHNGDIISASQIEELTEQFGGKISDFMVGRGLIMFPNLALSIKGIAANEQELRQKWREFHHQLIYYYSTRYQEHQLLPKMTAFWEYFAQSFQQDHKAFKLIKKSKNSQTFLSQVSAVLNHFEFKAL